MQKIIIVAVMILLEIILISLVAEEEPSKLSSYIQAAIFSIIVIAALYMRFALN